MKTLPRRWLVNLKKEKDSLLIEKFLIWFNGESREKPTGLFNFHGCWNGSIGFWNAGANNKYFITLKEWNETVFGLVSNEKFEKGEEVLVRDNDWNEWDDCATAIFITEFKGKYVVEWEGGIDTFDQCKKKPSELDTKIEELKKLAEEKGVKLTIICE